MKINLMLENYSNFKFINVVPCLQHLFSGLRTDLARDLKEFGFSFSAAFTATCWTRESNVVLLGSMILNLDGMEWLPVEKVEEVL